MQIGAMELAHCKDNKKDRERHKSPDRRSEEKRREEDVCQQRRAELFLLPATMQDLIQSRKRALNGQAVLNYQDLHGNDDYLFMFTEWEGCKSLAN